MYEEPLKSQYTEGNRSGVKDSGTSRMHVFPQRAARDAQSTIGKCKKVAERTRHPAYKARE